MRKLVSIVLILSLSGCGNSTSPTADNSSAIVSLALKEAGEIGTGQALKALAKNNPLGASETATILLKSINGTLLPYLNGANVGTAAEIQILLNSSVLNGIDPSVRNAIAAAAAVLDAYVKIPAAGGYLPATGRAYMVSFFTGVANACDSFNSKRALAVPANTRWIELAP